VVLAIPVLALGRDQIDSIAVYLDVNGHVLALRVVTLLDHPVEQLIVDVLQGVWRVLRQRDEQVDIGPTPIGGALRRGTARKDIREIDASPLRNDWLKPALHVSHRGIWAGIDRFADKDAL
jgi:hypothetical protein